MFGVNLGKTHNLFGLELPKVTYYYFLLLLLVVIAVVICYRLERSRIGRAWMAIREDEIAAKAMGINTRNMKLLAFGMGATFGGVSGVMFASFQGFISLLVARGILALLLALTGVYAVVSFSVSQRTREIGIRTALGAQRNDVVFLVLRSGAVPVMAGMVAGVGLALALSTVMKSILFGVSPRDPMQRRIDRPGSLTKPTRRVVDVVAAQATAALARGGASRPRMSGTDPLCR